MTQHNQIKLFEEKKVRTLWDDQSILCPKAEPFKLWMAKVSI